MKPRTITVIVVAVVVPILLLGGIAFGLLAVIAGQAASATAAVDSGKCEVTYKGEGLSIDDGQGGTVFMRELTLTNAAQIYIVGTRLGVPLPGIKIAIMTALQESMLKVLANSTIPESLSFPNQGRGSDHDSLNLFQQRPSTGWGTVEDLMNPDYAIRAFFGGSTGPNQGSPRGLLDIEGWETMAPGAAAQAVQGSAYPTRYARWDKAADQLIKAVANPSNVTVVCTDGADISEDTKQLAQTLVDSMDSGRLTVFGAHAAQIRHMAIGDGTDQCQLDVGVLQIIAFTLQHFDTVKISSLNRRCTSETPGAGTRSYHWRGQAVDFSALNGKAVTGWDQNSLKLAKLLEPFMPVGLAGIGQSDCRADHGVSLLLPNFIQFADGCNHLHVEIRRPNVPLNFSNS